MGHIYETGGIRDFRTGKIHKLTNVRIEKARELFKEAADQDCRLAQNYLGCLFFNHDKDFMSAIKHFKQAAQGGKCAQAFNNLGICYEVGLEEYNLTNNISSNDVSEGPQQLHRDINKAADLYLQAAHQSYVPAMVNLATLLFKSAKNCKQLIYGDKKPKPESLDQDDSVFEDDLEEMYFESANWLRTALSEQESNPEANFLMGVLFEQGLSVDVSHERAFCYFETASQSGHINAFTKLGHFYYSGVKKAEFIQQELDSMKYGYARGGSSDPVAPPSGEANSRMYVIPPDKSKAVKCYLKAIEAGSDIEAYYCLGLLFETGVGVDIELEHSKSNQHGGRSGRRERPISSGRDKLSSQSNYSRRSRAAQDVRDSAESLQFPWEDESNPNRGVFKAQRMYELALKKDPDFKDCLFNLGILKYRLSSSIDLTARNRPHHEGQRHQRGQDNDFTEQQR